MKIFKYNKVERILWNKHLFTTLINIYYACCVIYHLTTHPSANGLADFFLENQIVDIPPQLLNFVIIAGKQP